MTIRELIAELSKAQNLDHHITVKIPWYPPHIRFHIRFFESYDEANSGNEYLTLGTEHDILSDEDIMRVPA